MEILKISRFADHFQFKESDDVSGSCCSSDPVKQIIIFVSERPMMTWSTHSQVVFHMLYSHLVAVIYGCIVYMKL